MKDFHCNSCGYNFKLDSNDDACCPKCSSGDVKAVTLTKPKIYGLIAAFLCSAVIGYFLCGLGVKDKDAGFATEPGTIAEAEALSTGDNDKAEDKGGITIDDSKANTLDDLKENSKEKESNIDDELVGASGMTVTNTTPKAIGKGVYSFTATAKNVPKGCTVSYYLRGANGKLLGSSSSGRFPSVKPNSSVCTLVVKAMRSGKLVASTSKAIGGFSSVSDQDEDKEKEKPSGNRLSVSELQSMFARHDPSLLGAGSNPRISKHVALSFTNLRSDDPKPRVIQDIYNKIRFGQWTSASVVGVGYDSSGKVNSITFSINYADD